MITKICKRCSKEQPLTNEFFQWQKSRNSFTAMCRICHKKSVKRYRINNPEKIKEYVAKNKEHISNYHKKYMSNPDNKKRKQQYGKDWYAKNRDNKLKQNRNWFLANKDKHKELRTNWYKNNKHRVYANYHKRKRALNKQMPKWYQHDKVLSVFKKAISMRQQKKDVSVDHVIPLQGKFVSGLHVHTNLKIIPHKENCGKQNRIKVGKPMEYYFGKNWLPKESYTI